MRQRSEFPAIGVSHMKIVAPESALGVIAVDGEPLLIERQCQIGRCGNGATVNRDIAPRRRKRRIRRRFPRCSERSAVYIITRFDTDQQNLPSVKLGQTLDRTPPAFAIQIREWHRKVENVQQRQPCEQGSHNRIP